MAIQSPRKRRKPRVTKPAVSGQQRLSDLLTILAGIATVLTVVGSFTIYVWTTSRNVATVPYVDDSFKAALKHSDEKSADILRQAFAHADENRASTMETVNKINSENRETMAKVTTALDNLVKSFDRAEDRRARPNVRR